MKNQNKELNSPLSVGDRIMCIHMEGESAVPMGTNGTVTKTVRDPFEIDDKIISVDWDNGSKLSLLQSMDSWIKITQKTIEEQRDLMFNYFAENPEVFENFDWRFLREFLNTLKKAGSVNMFQSQSFLYSGREWIDRYYGEHQEDNEDFQKVLEMADQAKNKMIQGVLKYMESKGEEIDLEKVNRLVIRFASKILNLYISFF